MKVLSTRRRLLVAWAFLLPNFVGFLVFTAGPVVFSLWMAFTDWSLVRHNDLTGERPSFIGFENFARLLWGDESAFFWDAFGNTLYLMLGIPLGIGGSLGVALLLNRPVGPARTRSRWIGAAGALALGLVAAGAAWLVAHPGPLSADAAVEIAREHALRARSANALAALLAVLGLVTATGLVAGVVFFRTLFYLPSLLAGVALFLLWKSLYKPTGGAINVVLEPVLDGLQSAVTATPAAVWYGLGGLLALAVLALAAAWIAGLVRRGREGDLTVGQGVGSALALLTAVAVGLGLAYVTVQLPPRALLPTGLAPIPAESVRDIGDALAAEFPEADRADLEVVLATFAEGEARPRVLRESLLRWAPPEGAAIVDERVAAATGPVHAGYTAGAGLEPPKWLVDATWAKPALIIMGVWTAVGGANMLLYLAGLAGIPDELYEAAAIDGAGPWTRFRSVTWPQLAPTTFFIVIMSTIGGLQGGFEQAQAMTDGKYGTKVLTFYLYEIAFTDEFQLGLASAVAWIMFAIIFTMTVINYRVGSRIVAE